MKIKNLWMVLMVLFSGSFFSNVQADFKVPTVFGELNVAAIDKKTGDDWHFKAVEALVGVKGEYIPEETDFFKVFYNVELDITKALNAADASDEFTIENAFFGFVTPYGLFIACPTGESKQQADLYAAVDQFEIFEADANGSLFDQPDDGPGAIAYVTPIFFGFEFDCAVLSLGDIYDDNNEEIEAWSVKLMYDKKGVGPGAVSAGIGYVSISETVVVVEDYSRFAFTGQYLFNSGHNIGFTFESINNQPEFNDFTTLGIAGKIQLPHNFAVKAAFITQNDHRDGEGIIANLTYKPAKNVDIYVEYAEYNNVTPDPSYLAIGTKFVF